MSGTPFTIVGVAEPRLTGVTPGSDHHVWLPLSAGPRITDARTWRNRRADPACCWLTFLGRMKPGTTDPQVQVEVAAVFRNEMLYGALRLLDAEPVIRRTVAEISPNLPLQNVTTESQQIDRLLFRERLVARLAGLFGLLAVVLACIGLYGLLAHEVARRTREIGTRMALGAQAGDVLWLVMKDGLALVLVGAGAGVGLALGATRYLESMLYGVNAKDPVTMGAVGLLLMLVALAACWIPARRATRVDLVAALRYE